MLAICSFNLEESLTMDKEKHLTQVRCLAFPSPDKGGKWCAVALEMDIWGFDNTAEEAMKDLDELIEIQIEFAAGKKSLSVLDHPTDKKWFELWDILQKMEIEQVVTQSSSRPLYSPKECNFVAA